MCLTRRDTARVYHEFDVVHARLLVTVSKGGDPGQFLHNGSRMLKLARRLASVGRLQVSRRASTHVPSILSEGTGMLKAFYTHLEIKPERFRG